ncbi:hypothetical protein PHYPSEUDO_009410 [Phytophthora pseudosyringae]|uniref:Uncharacterized protein n=1 Tax=Phytophthora pseudosyringae TaxID=221518 RepID=A0A8T1VHF8_9STRA|nr:hypothetical protein PHYPSEUDO_009410 [Phytophthora pseudosyringae]
MEGLWAFSDDGDDEFVNIVVPGFGHCLAQRSDLVFHEPTGKMPSEHGPQSLTVQFNKYGHYGCGDDEESDETGNDEKEAPVSDGLNAFLVKSGSSLKNLAQR